MSEQKEFKRGDQIAYVPNHANSVDHPDVEFGFVTSVRNDTVFCRYWSKFNSGLRTKANSEGADARNIIHYPTRSNEDVQRALAWIEEEDQKLLKRVDFGEGK